MVLSGAFAQRTPYGYRREAGSLLQQDLTEPNARALELAELCEKLHADLLGPARTDSARAAALADSLIELNGLSDRLRRHVTALRFDSLERIHEGLARLRSQPSIAELMPQTAEELARCAGSTEPWSPAYGARRGELKRRGSRRTTTSRCQPGSRIT